MTPPAPFTRLGNGDALSWADLAEVPAADLSDATGAQLDRGARLASLFGVEDGRGTRLVVVLAYDAAGELAIGRTRPFTGAFPSLTASHAEAHLFEREVFEQHGLVPEGHPWLRPVRRASAAGPATGDFFRVDGGEVHEVAVGPVHAGVIEPGHFRFQCAGEEVIHLEIALGYQHRGVEEALVGGPHRTTAIQMETVAGDSTAAHATAYAEIVEALAGTEAPLRAAWLRAIALELERLANHTGDLGALAGDVAFLPTAAACGKTRGDFLNLTAELCGNRFSRGLVRPGGVTRALDADRASRVEGRLATALEDAERAARWLWDSASARARFEGTGTLTGKDAAQLGLVGPAARACGLVQDVRYDHPTGWYRLVEVPVSVWPDGDAFARARVRWLEIQRSGELLREVLGRGPRGPERVEVPVLAAGRVAVSMVEGWRGEVLHVALTDADGRFCRYKITDPSFHNWTGLALAMRGQAISDFPLVNKSFNLSYAGHDL